VALGCEVGQDVSARFAGAAGEDNAHGQS
jgi:hypothetical protein